MLASILGGALGGVPTGFLPFLGELLFPGLLLGIAQAPVLWFYLTSPTKRTVVLWVLASFFGWFTGLIALTLVHEVLSGALGVLEFARQVGSVFAWLVGTETARVQALRLLVWAFFAAFQAVALALAVYDAERRWLLPLATLWLLLGTVGGTLGLMVDLYINAQVFTDDAGSFFFDRISGPATGQAAAGALYGATTGMVLAIIARRSASDNVRA